MIRQLLSGKRLLHPRQWLYSLLGCLTTLTILITGISSSYSFSLGDILFRGIQIFQISNMSDQQEIQLGSKINQQLINNGDISILNNSAVTAYVNEVGQRLAKQSTRPNLTYTFQVVNDNTINAFATMGGYVYIHTGILKTATNEAELAGVMGHEIGHIAGRHALKQMKQQAINAGLLSVAGLDQNAAVNIGVDLALNRPNSREDELEADRLGLENIRKAGYAPSGMVSFMKKLQQQSGGSNVPTFLSTHPATGDRITLLEQSINSQPANTNPTGGLDINSYKNRLRTLR